MATYTSNLAWVTVKPPVPLANTGWEVNVISPDDWASVVARITSFSELVLSDSSAPGDQGAGSLTIPPEHPALTTPLPNSLAGTIKDREYLFKIYENGQFRGEWLGQDLEDDIVPATEGSARVKIAGQSTLTVLSWGKMVPMLAWDDESDTLAFSSKDFLATPSINALIWLIGHVQIRGVIPFIELMFDETVDSKGVPWRDLPDTYVDPGESPLDLLTRLADAHGWEYRMLEGFRLFVAQDSTGSHREESVKFFIGGDQKTHQLKASSRELVNSVYSPAADGSMATAVGTSDASPWIREGWVEAGSEATATGAAAVAQATLEMYQNRQVGRTIAVGSREGRVPFDDFGVNDWVTVEDGAFHPEVVQISQLTVTINSNSQPSYEVVVMTQFEVTAVRLKRLLDKLGGSALGSSSSTPISAGSTAQATVRFMQLRDVAVSSAPDGALLFKSGEMVLAKLLGIDEMNDVDTTTVPPLSGQVLAWNGTQWAPANASGGASSLSGLTDVNTTGVANGSVLKYNSSTGKWIPGTDVVGATTYAALTDVTVAGLANGQVMKYNSSTGKWTPSSDVGATALSALTDVDTSGVVSGKVLEYNGTKWVPTTPASGGTTALAGLTTDVDLTGIGTGKVLAYNGTKWVPTTPTSGGASTLDGLSDVDTTGAVTGQVLEFNGTSWAPADVVAGGGIGVDSIWKSVLSAPGDTFTGWTSAQGTWDSDGTSINQTGLGAVNRAYSTLEGAFMPSSPAFEAEVQLVSGTGADRSLGLILGCPTLSGESASGAIIARVQYTGSVWNMLIEREGVATVATVPLGSSPTLGTWHKMRVEAGAFVTVYWDDVLIVTAAVATTLSANRIALYTRYASAKFRNIHVWKLADVQASTLLSSKGDLLTVGEAGISVLAASTTTGEVLTADPASPTGLSWSEVRLSSLSDVMVSSSPPVGRSLVWNGTYWVIPGDLPLPYDISWVTDGYNGVFNVLGEAQGGGTFTNPAVGVDAYIATSQSSIYSGSTGAVNATDHSHTSYIETGNGSNEWWKVDFKTRQFAINRIGIISASNPINPRNFDVEGSNDNSSWTTLLSVVNDGPGPGAAAGAWWSASISGAAAYRYLRVRQTGPAVQGSGWNYLTVGDFEMWGTLS